jgi:hypothetical protein
MSGHGLSAQPYLKQSWVVTLFLALTGIICIVFLSRATLGRKTSSADTDPGRFQKVLYPGRLWPSSQILDYGPVLQNITVL